MRKFIIVFGISVVSLFIGSISYSLLKAIKWSHHFGMTYFEFSYNLKVALDLLRVGKSLEYILSKTGIDFNYKELRKYFLNDEEEKGNPDFHIYKSGEKV